MPSSGLAYAARRDGRPVLVLRAAPPLDALPELGVSQILGVQLPRRAAGSDNGARALLVWLLVYALHEAELGPLGRRQGPAPGSSRAGRRSRPALRTAARRWLLRRVRGRGRAAHRLRLRCPRPGCRRARRGRARACPAVIVPRRRRRAARRARATRRPPPRSRSCPGTGGGGGPLAGPAGQGLDREAAPRDFRLATGPR